MGLDVDEFSDEFRRGSLNTLCACKEPKSWCSCRVGICKESDYPRARSSFRVIWRARYRDAFTDPPLASSLLMLVLLMAMRFFKVLLLIVGLGISTILNDLRWSNNAQFHCNKQSTLISFYGYIKSTTRNVQLYINRSFRVRGEELSYEVFRIKPFAQQAKQSIKISLALSQSSLSPHGAIFIMNLSSSANKVQALFH